MISSSNPSTMFKNAPTLGLGVLLSTAACHPGHVKPPHLEIPYETAENVQSLADCLVPNKKGARIELQGVLENEGTTYFSQRFPDRQSVADGRHQVLMVFFGNRVYIDERADGFLDFAREENGDVSRWRYIQIDRAIQDDYGKRAAAGLAVCREKRGGKTPLLAQGE